MGNMGLTLVNEMVFSGNGMNRNCPGWSLFGLSSDMPSFPTPCEVVCSGTTGRGGMNDIVTSRS